MAGSRKNVQLVRYLVLSLCFSAVNMEEEIVISQGKIRGTTLTSRNGRHFSAFLGIPYARPPIGLLRFKNPLPAGSWNGTFVADTDGNPCPQYDRDQKPIGDEDCLYLNVYTPKFPLFGSNFIDVEISGSIKKVPTEYKVFTLILQENSKRQKKSTPTVLYPTMVFIHGGAFFKGNGGTIYVAPGYIMDKDVVLVAMNYRLGVLGFFSTGDAEATGNFGLKDQVLALRWVQKNIKAFGGDPNRVTLFGQSSGSVSVNLHVMSDASDGLFHQYIAQSGSSLCMWGYNEIEVAMKHATDLGEYVNCPTNNSKILVDCLRDTDVHTLLATDNIFDSLTSMFHTWTPTREPFLEGAFLTASPIERILQYRVRDYPAIFGDVADEALLLTAHLHNNDALYGMISTDVKQFLQHVTSVFIQFDNLGNLVSNVNDFYFKDVDPSDKDAFMGRFTDLLTDTAFLIPTVVQMHIALQRMKNSFYFYSFEYRGTYSETMQFMHSNKNIGVTHSDDLIYIFPLNSEDVNLSEIKLSQFDERMVDVMIDLWTSFAYDGIPTSNHTTELNIWKPYNFDMRYLQIGQNSDPSVSLKNHFKEDRIHFWAMELLKIAFKMG